MRYAVSSCHTWPKITAAWPWPQRTVPKLPSGTNGCQTLKTATLNTSYFCQKRPLCQPPPSPTPPPNSHFVRKVKLRLAYRLAFVISIYIRMCIYIYIFFCFWKVFPRLYYTSLQSHPWNDDPQIWFFSFNDSLDGTYQKCGSQITPPIPCNSFSIRDVERHEEPQCSCGGMHGKKTRFYKEKWLITFLKQHPAKNTGTQGPYIQGLIFPKFFGLCITFSIFQGTCSFMLIDFQEFWTQCQTSYKKINQHVVHVSDCTHTYVMSAQWHTPEKSRLLVTLFWRKTPHVTRNSLIKIQSKTQFRCVYLFRDEMFCR